ncbi:hypothetical protein [Paractinoplanes hotanensis]|uniref:Uncharacterized protein n=1 Tax=Paractinoplanes hotanensis TaxID=2906497 RepID=A0ABT0YCM4_9ACTN|nr:hypothetical protein [Actinoplanes hotanensis]MCM4083815.1 hypothetical protein [Actinoplanes hotanensis]
MTISSLITALAVGTTFGLGGWWLIPAGRSVPFWVPLAVAVSAAMLATVVVRLAGIDTSGVTAVEVVVQMVFAGTGVGLVAATADRRFDGAGRSR